ncbi:MAG: hypothetical protein Kow0091_03300 [Geminocystis sp.]
MYSWHPSIIHLLEEKKYSKIIDYYQQIINTDPNNIINYWYLGLAYLLNKNLENAQATWLLCLSNIEESAYDQSIEILKNILETEALRQLYSSNYSLSLLIRQQINDLDETDVNNQLHIINLELLLETFNIENILHYDIINKIKNSAPDTLNLLLVLTILEDILKKYTHGLSVLLAESILHYSQGNQEVMNKIKSVAISMGEEKNHINYAIDLLELCNYFNHEDSRIFIHLNKFYERIKNYEKQLNICQQYYQKASNYIEKLSSINCLLSYYRTMGDRDNFAQLVSEQSQLYEQIEEKKDSLKDEQNKEIIIIGIIDFFYCQDLPQYNRNLINKVAQVFQDINKPCYPNFVFQYQHQECLLPPKAEADQGQFYPLKLRIIEPKKVLKIGYIAHTFNDHAVGYISRCLIRNHDRTKFDINLYMAQGKIDEITTKDFQPYVSQIFRGNRNVRALTEKIYDDDIDILVDLDSVTQNLTCTVMAVKPAPIQVTWLGLDASGIPNIDYFIVDPYVLPENAQEYYQEKLWRLPHNYLAIDNLEIGEKTLTRKQLNIPDDAVIYLNMQNAAKLNPHIVQMQMEIIQNVKNSYLLFNVRKDENVLKKYLYSLADKFQGVKDRIRFIPSYPPAIYRANLAIADIILDTYPFNGAVTVLDSLWQNIPLVTRVGQQYHARQGYSFLKNLGIEEGIAWTDRKYIEWGIKFGNSGKLREKIREQLQQSKLNSSLWNTEQFTRDMEKAYQQMWQIYLKSIG